MWGKQKFSQKPYLILLILIMGVSIGSASALVVHNENVRVNGEFKIVGGTATVQRIGAQSAIVVQNDGSANTIKFSDLTTGQEQIFQFRQIKTGDRLDIFDVTNNGVRIAILAPSGNVGIGTTAPTEKLDVNGNLRVRGDIDVSGPLATDDDTIFFDDGTKFLQWEDAPFNEFFFNAPLGVGGGLLVDDSMQLGGHFEITSTFLDTAYNRMGQTTSNHGLNDNQDLFIGKSLEVDGPSWFDGQMQITTTDPTTPLGIDLLSGDGPLIVFTRDGSFVGGIDVAGGTVTYGAFTGAHYAWTDEYLSVGMLVSLTGNNQYLGEPSQSEIIYGITKSSQKNNPAILGTYLATKTSPLVSKINDVHLVMAEGNGDVWVADMGEDINPGDYLISSSVAGHAMKDDRSEELSHIIGRAAEPVLWSEVSDTIEGVKHKRISILFNFVPLNNN